jgi:hypothetical protein
LVPKDSGGRIVFSVTQTNGTVECMIDDDGIGRELSGKYRLNTKLLTNQKGSE